MQPHNDEMTDADRQLVRDAVAELQALMKTGRRPSHSLTEKERAKLEAMAQEVGHWGTPECY